MDNPTEMIRFIILWFGSVFGSTFFSELAVHYPIKPRRSVAEANFLFRKIPLPNHLCVWGNRMWNQRC